MAKGDRTKLVIENDDQWAVEVSSGPSFGIGKVGLDVTDYNIGRTAEVSMTPEQARTLARALLVEADRIDPPTTDDSATTWYSLD